MMPELHLFIVWEHAASLVQPIMENILSKFTVKKALQIHWTPSVFSSNLSRFYNQQLPSGCEKELHCGKGPFFCIVVLDERPVYGQRHTSKGTLLVNTNVFDAKTMYRQWTGGGHRIHATNTPRECARDLNLLLGYDPDTFIREHPQNWDGHCPEWHRDIMGANGWQNMSQLFSFLNTTTDYVVLRNFEHLPSVYSTELHGDIDLLVRDPVDVASLLNGKKVFSEPYRVHYEVAVGGNPVFFDFRYVGDEYMDEDWERSILKNKMFSSKGFFVPQPGDYFYSLLYHAAVHKPFISPEYYARLSKMAEQLSISNFSPSVMSDTRSLRHFLHEYLKNQKYNFTAPRDSSVFFNHRLLEAI